MIEVDILWKKISPLEKKAASPFRAAGIYYVTVTEACTINYNGRGLETWSIDSLWGWRRRWSRKFWSLSLTGWRLLPSDLERKNDLSQTPHDLMGVAKGLDFWSPQWKNIMVSRDFQRGRLAAVGWERRGVWKSAPYNEFKHLSSIPCHWLQWLIFSTPVKLTSH